MGYRGTTTEQPSDQPEEEPYQLRLDHVPLIIGIVSLTVAVLLAILDNVAKADYIRGMYSILTGLFVTGIVGWQVRSGQARVRRMVECHARADDVRLAELTSAVAKLTSVVKELRGPDVGGRDPAGADTWWSGYATAIEDQESGMPRTVLPFKLPRGDRNGDSGRRVNGSELP